MPIVSVDRFVTTNFDYVVVGGGTAGLVVAARLTEDPSVIVGVIEAGSSHENDPLIDIPGMTGRAAHKPEYDWDFKTTPQKYVKDRQLGQSRGKGLGGSSILNFLAMVRPGKIELDALEELGNPGWSWDNLLQYMKKCERTPDPPQYTHDLATKYAVTPTAEYRGTDGPIAVSFPSHITPALPALLDSLELNGLPRNPDSGNGNPVGGFLVTSNVDATKGVRSHSASAYYTPNAERPNLLVLTDALATKIKLEATENGLQRAAGVVFSYDDKSYEVTADREVILSAGTFQNPQLLELSGIGDERILRSFGIETKVTLPGVGENLQDHALVPTIVEVDSSIKSVEILFDTPQLAEQEELYKKQQGILAGMLSSAFAFIPSHLIGSPDDIARWTSLSSLNGSASEIFSKTNPSVRKGIEKQYEVLRRWIGNPEQPISEILTFNGHIPVPGVTVDVSKRYQTLFLAYSHPFHRGTVHIRSSDAQEPPLINQNYFSNPADLEVMIRTIRWMKKVFDTEPYKSLVTKHVMPTYEETDEELVDWVKERLGTVFHPVGTCAMMPREIGGVVDSKLLVYGTTNLRIIDASIIPLELSCPIQAFVYAIGEKGADIVKGAT